MICWLYGHSSILISGPTDEVDQDGNISSSLGGLASLAGFDLGGLSGSSGSINPALYQSVARSTPFLLELMNQQYYFSEVEENLTLEEFFYEHAKSSLASKIIRFPITILQAIRGDQQEDSASNSNRTEAIKISLDQKRVLEKLMERVSVEMDWDLNLVTIRVRMQDPVVAAEMAQFTQEYITNFVINYAVLKNRNQLISIEEQYLSRKEEFERAQFRLASFRDKNQNVSTSRARSEEERLQSEYNLAFNIYNQLAQQREAIKLQIKENTPVFTVLEPVKIPVEKSEPRRLMILIGFTFIGFSVVSLSILVINVFIK